MSNPLHDLDDLAGLWAEEASADEQAELQAMAARVSVRASLFHYADLGLGVAIAAGVLIALFANPAPVTVAVGLVAAALLLWSTWQRHQLRQEIQLLLTVENRSDLVELEIQRAERKLLHARLGLWAGPPVMILFALLTYAMANDGSLAGVTAHLVRSATFLPFGPIVAAAILTLLYQQAQSVRSLRRALDRLRRLWGDYREETRLDALALG